MDGLDYYATHGPLTEPGDHAGELARLPADLLADCRFIQGIQFMLADMQIATEAARCMLYDCARMADRQDWDGFSAKASMVKCFASDTAMKVTTDAVQIFGGAGYMQDFPVERFMRDAKINQIFEGTNQIQRLVIARHMLRH